MSPLWMGEGEKPSRAVLHYGPAATQTRLRELFPRGRLTRQADGMPILVARVRALAGCHVYEQAPGRLLGLFYKGSPRRWVNRLGDLAVWHLAGEGEGVMYVRWCPEAAARLCAFSRGRQGTPGRPYQARLGPENGPRNDAAAPGAISCPGTAMDGQEPSGGTA